MSLGPVRREAPPAPPPPRDPPAPGAAVAPAPRPSDEPSPFARLLHGLGHEVASGESTMRAAMRATRAGRDLGPAELIALQAGVYRYSEAVDLASRLVDRATSGVKTIVQGGQ